jgi:MSHA pilin protein MshD
MCTTKPRQAGFSLIELIFFIVVVSVGLAGILMVMDVSVKSSADPMVRKQAMALADSLMEEILLKPFVDPDGVSGETTRATFDDVSDYNGINEVISAAGPVFLGMPANLNGYRVKIDVVADTTTLGTVTSIKVTVTVSKGANSISMTGYRTQDPP